MMSFPVVLALTLTLVWSRGQAQGEALDPMDQQESGAQDWLRHTNAEITLLYNRYMRAMWAYQTNLTEYNKKAFLTTSAEKANFMKARYKELIQYNWQHFTNEDLKRQLRTLILSSDSTDLLPEDDVAKYQGLMADMEKIHSVAQVCGKPGDPDPTKCYGYNPDLTGLMRSSRDWDTLLWAWQGFRENPGRRLKENFTEEVRYLKQASASIGKSDMGATWRASYESEADIQMRDEVMRLWAQIKPLYEKLFFYARKKLKAFYQDPVDAFPESGHIPAHILGSMWAVGWDSLMDILAPTENTKGLDVDVELKHQNYTAVRMFKLAEDFFGSMGLGSMPANFYRDSMLTRPTDGRQVVCHASAWDFFTGNDFRIKMCTAITTADLVTIHHEMGHIHYFMATRDQPPAFSTSANPGFHEAVGETIALAVNTATHLQQIGLMNSQTNSKDVEVGMLMAMALDRVMHLPLALSIDMWRWDIFAGNVQPDEYNDYWWKLRCELQGVYPPVPRTPDDFDPGTIWHVVTNTPYIRYFVATVLQFQFYKSLCETAGHTGPLHQCDFYGSAEAGTKLRNMMRPGASEPWPDALEAITGQREMDAGPLLEYFQPLVQWLDENGDEADQTTWGADCPMSSFASGANRPKAEHCLTAAILAVAAILAQLLTPMSWSIEP